MSTKKNNSVKGNSKKETVKETSKVDYSKLTLEQVLEMNDDTLDESIIISLLEQNKDIQSFSKKKTKNGKKTLYKESAYKENESSKQFRNRIRKERNNLIQNILINISNKDILKTAITSFDKFYKETYSLNDYSLESLGRKNSDNDTMANIKLALKIVKLNK